ncbi:MAG: EFR1 family ferrodoxin [Oscillospiraceae bacterium]|jgi:ferredoxin/flavodoxin|nr:EFR1 family ferrodoxin [Oscillospiraceae bacterium]
MIFYFSATGNSKYAAERLAAATEDRVVFLRDAIRSRSYRYDIGREERVGFVVPVYFQGLPSILHFFLKKLELAGYKGQYIYLVLTCGQWAGNAAGQMAALLEKRGLSLSARFAVVMVDNYVPAFTVPSGEDAALILDDAEEAIGEICRAVRARGVGDYIRCAGPAPSLQTALMYPAYSLGRSTKPFIVTDHCIGCGLCQEICPCGAILITGGKPAWVKSKCVRCLGCLHRCPAQAIHWKKTEEDRGRYYNPRVEP